MSIPTTTRRGYKIGHITEQILFNKYRPSLTDEEQRQQAVYVQKHHQERLDLVDAIEVCCKCKHRVLEAHLRARYHITGVIVKTTDPGGRDDMEGQDMLRRVIGRLNARIVSLYGSVVHA